MTRTALSFAVPLLISGIAVSISARAWWDHVVRQAGRGRLAATAGYAPWVDQARCVPQGARILAAALRRPHVCAIAIHATREWAAQSYVRIDAWGHLTEAATWYNGDSVRIWSTADSMRHALQERGGRYFRCRTPADVETWAFQGHYVTLTTTVRHPPRAFDPDGYAVVHVKAKPGDVPRYCKAETHGPAA